MTQPTIAAIATPPGPGAVSMVRLSGPEAISVAAKIFRPNSGKLESLEGYRGMLGKVYEEDNNPVDEVIAFLYRAPKSYTGEDLVELCCHGGGYPAGVILRLCLKSGAVPAGPGEFTKRAFLNGKMDLTAAEAVMDLVGAQGKTAMRAALAAKEGALGGRVKEIADGLTGWSAQIAAWCDYPEEDLIPVDSQALAAALKRLSDQTRQLLAGYDRGKMLRQGVRVAILGRPNVGKSTLMNLLTGQDTSIVTQNPGTTRDLVSEQISIAGLAVTLLDTAGIRRTDDPAEAQGVERSIAQLARAQLILAVFDASQPLDEDDRRLISQLTGKNAITIANKSDLPSKLDEKEIAAHLSGPVYISAATGQGRAELEEAVLAALHLKEIDPAAALVANERQRLCLADAQSALEEAIQALESGFTLDAVGVCLDFALTHLLTLTGERATEAVVDRVFAEFCVGK